MKPNKWGYYIEYYHHENFTPYTLWRDLSRGYQDSIIGDFALKKNAVILMKELSREAKLKYDNHGRNT